MNQEEELVELEEKESNKLELLLLALLIGFSTRRQLVYNSNKLAAKLVSEIEDMRKASEVIADKQFDSPKKTKIDKDRNMIITSASLYTISYVLKKIFISKQTTLIGKIKEAVTQTKSVLDRIVTTEIFEANHTKMIKNGNKTTKYRWSAQLDKRTCPVCARLDGNIYTRDNVPAYPHSRCRCTIYPV